MPNDVPAHAAELMDRIQSGPIRTGWHCLGYNFTLGADGFMSVGGVTVLALAQVDAVMPGFADEQLSGLEAMGGPEKNMQHYAQIVSWYAELLVCLKLAEHPWPAPTTFLMEPTAGDSKYNPEVVIELDGVGSLGVEAKAANLLEHSKTRSTNPWQLAGRTEITQANLEGAVHTPTRQPCKGLPRPCGQEFAGFRAADPDFRSILVIIWDDFINEPVTALLSRPPDCLHQTRSTARTTRRSSIRTSTRSCSFVTSTRSSGLSAAEHWSMTDRTSWTSVEETTSRRTLWSRTRPERISRPSSSTVSKPSRSRH